MGLSTADGIVIVLLVVSAAMGIYRGLLREILTLITWVVAVYLAFKFGKDISGMFSFVEASSIREGLGIAFIFFSVLLLGAIIKFIVCKAFGIAGPSVVDRVGGLAFGLARVCVLIIAIFLIAPNSIQEQSWYAKSKIMPTFNAAATMIAKSTPKTWKTEAQSQLESVVF